MEGGHRIDLVRHRVSPALDGLVAGVVGLSERAPGVVRRRQPAGTLLPLVFSFGNPLTIGPVADAAGAASYESFLAGLSSSPATTQFEDGQDCVQVYLTPIGARRILGVPGSQVAGRVLAVRDVGPRTDGYLTERLRGATTWTERFDLVERVLLQQLEREVGAPAWVGWMWSQIAQSGGRVRIRDLVDRTGWSHRYVTTVFAEEIGLTPKRAAGIVRFERAAADLGRFPLAEIAARRGYADQSHLARDVARYAGETPSELAAAQRPTAWTALGPLARTRR
ncbi:helix-turn-helix domain-containing protein [Mumia qirimensis]|uniref:helix-turn-helix domain-containing protein n=1 Tax=Mumia qirimensis TaxID=3234852 RepID=UPI00351D7A48